MSNGSHSSDASTNTSRVSSRTSTPGRGRYSSEFVTREESQFVDRALFAGFNHSTVTTHVDVDLDNDLDLEMDGGLLSGYKGCCKCRDCCLSKSDADGTLETGVDNYNNYNTQTRRRLIANHTYRRASTLAQVLVLADRLLLTAVRRPMQIALQYLGSIGLAVALSAGE